MRRLRLENGKHLAERPDGGWTLFPDERIVDVDFADGVATYDAAGSPGDGQETSRIVGEASDQTATRRRRSRPHAAGPANQPGRSEDATRWDALNEFEDEIAPHLTLSEQAVWHYLFRWCRRDRTEASVRLLSRGRRMDYKTAAAALRHIMQIGLVRQLHKSTHKHARSTYAMTPRPSRCREAAIDADAARQAKRKSRPPPPRRTRKPR